MPPFLSLSTAAFSSFWTRLLLFLDVHREAGEPSNELSSARCVVVGDRAKQPIFPVEALSTRVPRLCGLALRSYSEATSS